MRFRPNLRRLMAIVALAALATWLAIPAARIARQPGRSNLVHLWRRKDGSYLFSAHPVGVWPRYRHDLLGLDWNCPDPICRDNRALHTEIATAPSVSDLLRTHPESLMGNPR